MTLALLVSFLILPTFSAWAGCHNMMNPACPQGTQCLENAGAHFCGLPQNTFQPSVQPPDIGVGELTPPSIDLTPPKVSEEDIGGKGLGGALDFLSIFGKGSGFPVENPDEPEVLVGKIIQGALVVIGVIFGILIVYAGYLWMIARGNEEMVKKAIETLQTAVIGFIIVVGAYAITSYVVGKVIPAAFPTADTEEP